MGFGNDGVLVTQRIGQAPHEIKQAIATGLDMGAVLDVILRPEARCGLVVTLVVDRGMANDENLATIRKAGYHWLVAARQPERAL